ncbi:MAG: response regulator transcription factor [Clostridiales bacterium]|nr:response regulator transcription factor [Clostridiales bacterium]
MRFAIVDDDEKIRRDTEKKISSYYGRENVSCFLFSDGDEIIRSIETGFTYDAVFLDIEMERTDGMSAAREIREISKGLPIVFLTSHTDMAMEGYEVSAFRFLGKPVEEDKLRKTLTDLELLIKKDNKITLTKDGEELVFPVKDLIYAEARNNCVRFVFTREEQEVRMKLGDAYDMLRQAGGTFYKIHRSYIVNLARIKKVNTTDVLTDRGELLPIARGKAPDVKKALLEYIRKAGR